MDRGKGVGMKSFQTHMIAMVFCVMFFGTQYFSLALAGEKIPEFDGGYVKTTKNDIIEIRSVNCEVFYTRDLNERYLIKSLPKMINVPTQDFKGFIVKGGYDFSSFSLHPLEMNEEKINWKDTIVYQPGKALELRKKAVAKDGYYFQPRNKIEQGVYVGWIGRNFWIFSIGEGKDVSFYKALSLYEKKKYNEALSPFEKAAKNQHINASRYLGMMYSDGIGTKQDYKKAIEWYHKASDQGDVRAQQRLAWIYATCEDPQFHNGKLAVNYALKAYSQKPKNFEYLDTLAVAYARNAQFDMAIKTQEKLLHLFKGPFLPPEEFKLYEESKEKIRMYKSGQAYDESFDLHAVIQARKKRKEKEKRLQEELKAEKIRIRKEYEEKERKRLTALKTKSKEPTKLISEFSYEADIGSQGIRLTKGKITDTLLKLTLYKKQYVNEEWKLAFNGADSITVWYGDIHSIHNVGDIKWANSNQLQIRNNRGHTWVLWCKDASKIDTFYDTIVSAISDWYDKYSEVAPKKRPAFLIAPINRPEQKTQGQAALKQEDKEVEKKNQEEARIAALKEEARKKRLTRLSNGFSGKWVGTYNCNQGITGLTLSISTNSTVMSAIFDFYPSRQSSKAKSGSFNLSGRFSEDGSFNLQPKAWIKRPKGYRMVGMSGKIDNALKELEGSIHFRGCSNFQLVKE